MLRLAALLTLLAIAGPPALAGITAAPHSDPVPGSIAPPIAALIAPGGVRAKAGSVTLDFWFVKQLALKPGDRGPWAGTDEGTLVGAVQVSAAYSDIRGRLIKPGVYTLRYGVQPDNGDHLGVSPFRDFLLLSPAAVDTAAAPKGHEGTIETSKQTIGGSHPAVLSIDPPAATEAPLSIRKTELGHEALVVEVPGPGGTPVRFGIVLVGRIEA
jgi:hypothetical protein